MRQEIEVLYGGAAGGGKSDALLMAAAQFVEVPGYAALILRKTFADLSMPGALIDRSHAWWDGQWWDGRARWHGGEHKWTFPSGAVIQFGYAEHPGDERRYQSSEFQTICFDEGTQFQEAPYRFLFSRLRRLKGSSIPLRMRIASNPGGVGHDWVKKRWRIGRFESEPIAGRTFIRATLKDNPHLDADSYRELSLANLDPITREQLEAGDWEAYAGGRFKRDWLRKRFRRHGSGFNLGGRIYTEEQVTDRFLTIDPATTPQEFEDTGSGYDPSWTVVSAWAIAPGGELLWLGCVRAKIEAPDIPPLAYPVYTSWGCKKAYCEGGGTQKGIFQLLRRYKPAAALPGSQMSVIEVIPKGSLLERIPNFANLCQAGRVWLPEDDPDFPLEDVIDELLRFTGDKNKDSYDDIVSTAAMAGDYVAGVIARKEASRHGVKPYVFGN